MYSDNTETIIKNRMLNNIPSDIDKTEGFFIYDNISPVSKELATAYGDMDQVLNKVFARTASENGYSEQLDLRCEEYGVTRKTGTLATGTVTFTGAENTVVPSGTTVQTISGLQFKTITVATITSGTAIISIQAVATGIAYNLPSSVIIQLPVAVNGITSVTNIDPTTGGNEIETDLALFQRLLLQVQSPATSGNSAHYKEWALQVSGIGLAQIFPLWNGNGTVKVCAIDSNMQPLSSDLVTALSTYVESQRPIGATVTYESALALSIDITVTVIKDTAYTQSQIQLALTDSVVAYLKEIAFKQNYVSYAKIGALIFDTPGVIDYNTLVVNGGTINVIIGNEQVAIATQGTVTVNID